MGNINKTKNHYYFEPQDKAVLKMEVTLLHPCLVLLRFLKFMTVHSLLGRDAAKNVFLAAYKLKVQRFIANLLGYYTETSPATSKETKSCKWTPAKQLEKLKGKLYAIPSSQG